jgi:hypothetical protein
VKLRAAGFFGLLLCFVAGAIAARVLAGHDTALPVLVTAGGLLFAVGFAVGAVLKRRVDVRTAPIPNGALPHKIGRGGRAMVLLFLLWLVGSSAGFTALHSVAFNMWWVFVHCCLIAGPCALALIMGESRRSKDAGE